MGRGGWACGACGGVGRCRGGMCGGGVALRRAADRSGGGLSGVARRCAAGCGVGGVEWSGAACRGVSWRGVARRVAAWRGDDMRRRDEKLNEETA